MRDNSLNRKYYKRESRWYDSTRDYFLFGRDELAKSVADITQNKTNSSDLKLLEVGCGTGYIERKLRQYGYKGWYFGIDISREMLSRFRTATDYGLVDSPYISFAALSDIQNIKTDFDIVLFSYPLTLMENWKENIDRASNLIRENNGCIAVADFHRTSNKVYSKYMKLHKVGIGQGTKEYLDDNLIPVNTTIAKSPLGIWEYFYGLWQNKD